MNLDAAKVLRWLENQPVPRKPTTIAKYTGLPQQRVDSAIKLLGAVDKIVQDPATGCWGIPGRVKVTL
jgi:DNA-binding IclR family transcriptional regulator